jgi:hypothetical protein
MSANTVGNIRLAAGSDRASILYNAYHLITQMAAFYANASQQRRPAQERAVFEQLSDDLIRELGDLYMAWEGLDTERAAPVPDSARLVRRVSHTCAQFSTIIARAGEWTPVTRMLALTVLMEKRWVRILKALKEGAGKESAVLSELTSRSEARREMIGAELQRRRLAGRMTQDSFDAADSSLLDKSFGF